MEPDAAAQVKPRVTYRVFRLTNPVLDVDLRMAMWAKGMVIEENQRPDRCGYSIVISVAAHRKEAFQQTLTDAGLEWSLVAFPCVTPQPSPHNESRITMSTPDNTPVVKQPQDYTPEDLALLIKGDPIEKRLAWAAYYLGQEWLTDNRDILDDIEVTVRIKATGQQMIVVPCIDKDDEGI